jgi:hypothetical protein
MIKVTMSVPNIASVMATYTHIQLGRAATSADATSRSGTFVDLGVVVALSSLVTAYDYLDEGAAVGQWYTWRPSNSTGSSGGSYSTPEKGQEQGYITVDQFREYEIGVLTNPDGTDMGDRKIERFIKVASGLVDAYTQQSFRIEQHTERHKWSQATRRIYPYRRPINSIVSLTVNVSAQQSAAFTVNDIFVNKDRNYFEVTSLATVTYSLFPVLVNLGLIEPVAILTYTSGFPEVPEDVKDATAIISSHLLAEESLIQQGLGGMSELTVGSMTMKRTAASPGVRLNGIPGTAAAILDRYVGVNVR